jgi:hypothetical protein
MLVEGYKMGGSGAKPFFPLATAERGSRLSTAQDSGTRHAPIDGKPGCGMIGGLSKKMAGCNCTDAKMELLEEDERS